jgi:hypothetical protein
MLDKTTYTPAAPAPSTIAGRTIAHSYTWSETKRVRLAAKATFGAVVVTPLTAIQASQVFDVPVTAVAGELKRLGVVLRHHNGNGHGHAAPTWESLTSEQKSAFLANNFDAIWNELEARTS